MNEIDGDYCYLNKYSEDKEEDMVCIYKAKALTFLLCALYVDANYFNFYVSKYKKCSLHLCALNITGEESGQSKNMN